MIEVGFEPFEPFYSTIIPADTDINPENASQSQQYHTLTIPYYSEKYYIWLYHVQDSQFGPVRVEVIYTQGDKTQLLHVIYFIQYQSFNAYILKIFVVQSNFEENFLDIISFEIVMSIYNGLKSNGNGVLTF